MGRGRFFESRVTGGASGRNTGSLKSWRDGPLSEQRSISERCIRFSKMVDSPHILRYRRNRNGRYAHWMRSTRQARTSCCRNRSLFRFTGIRHACYVESRYPERVSTSSSPAGSHIYVNIYVLVYLRANEYTSTRQRSRQKSAYTRKHQPRRRRHDDC